MKRILVIDDDPNMRRAIRAALATRRLEVEEAGDAAGGLASVRRAAPALVICDLHLERGSGWEVLQELRNRSETASVPFILITGSDDATVMRRGMNLGADDYLHKPFTNEELLAAVEARLRKQEHLKAQAERVKARLLGLLEATADLVAIVEADTQVVSYMNQAGREATGLNPDRTGAPVVLAELYSPAAFAEIERTALPAVRTHGRWRGEGLVVGGPHGPRHVVQEILAHPGANGEVDCLFVTAHDITGRRQMELAVAASEARLQAIAAAASDAIVMTDLEGRVSFWNRAAERIFGYLEGEALGRSLPELTLPTEIRPAFAEALPGLATADDDPAGGRLLELPARRKSGERFTAEISLAAARFSGRGHAVAIIRDVSQQRATTHLLIRERILLRTLVDALPDSIFAKDKEARKTLANLADARRLGARCEADVLGKTDYDLLDRQAAAALHADDLRVIHHGEAVRDREELLINARGERCWMQTTKLPLRDEAGRIVGLVGIGRDITERKRAEAERAALQLQINQAQKLESIGRLAAGIAHEINTPTQFIGDNLRFVRDSMSDLDPVLAGHRRLVAAARNGEISAALLAQVEAADQQADLEYLQTEIPKALDQSLEGVARVTKIVLAMKDFSHPGGAEKSAVDLNRAIESTVTVARNEWKYVADLHLELEPSLPAVPVLAGEFNQVILNLVVNAAQAIAEKVGDSGLKGAITVGTRQDGDWVEVRVADTGVGMPTHVRDKLFTPFFTTKPVGKGTGQGLALARSVIMDKHGGMITFESEEGIGTRFIIRLPLAATGMRPTPRVT